MSEVRDGPASAGSDRRRALRDALRGPLLTFLALIGLLAVNVATGYLQPFPHVWVLNLGVMVLMIAIVLLFSMEVIREPALVRFFSLLGFCWVGILLTMTLIDYMNR